MRYTKKDLIKEEKHKLL